MSRNSRSAVAKTAVRRTPPSYAELEARIAALTAELREAREQQTATAEVLQVINSSPGDLAPVFDAIVEKAHILCGAVCGSLQLWDGEMFRGVAMRGFSEEMAEGLRRGYIPGPNHPCRPLLAGARIAHCVDLAEIDDPVTRAGGVALGGVRTILFVALRKDDVLLGQIVAARQEVRLFSEKEIALVQNFAAQAVIAMENARLLTETREALEQQTATAEVLQVINSSPGDLAPVFDAILEKAHTLCGAAFGSLGIFDGETWRAVVQRGYGEPLASKLRQGGRGSDNPLLQELIDGAPFVHVADLAQLDLPIARANVAAGIRTLLLVALRKDDALLGTISIAGREPRPFSDKEIALLENFAAQAVIAMENARLMTETREALAQQTATAEVLQVINSSPGALTPVFDAVLEKAVGLCEAAFGSMLLNDGERFNTVAVRGVPAAFADYVKTERPVHGPGTGPARILAGERVVHIADLAAEEPYRIGDPQRRALVDLGGARSLVCVPLLRDAVVLGIIVVYRQEVRPFSDKQIALLQNFAAQAVIAMENARLLTETREALEQQTATADVMQVINSSPGDLAPVFDAILEKAHTLCGAAHWSLQLYDGENLYAVATNAVSEKFAEVLRHGYRAADSPASRALIEGKRFIQLADCAEVDHPIFRSAAELSGIRTVLFVPLRKDNAFLGLISAARLEVRPFSDKQIALLENFAAQAVIAMENARLLTETREALELQTATAEVLQVINSSPGDLAPVFDAVIENSMRLCEATQGHLYIYADGQIHAEALRGEPQFVEWQRRRGSHPVAPGSPTERALHGEQVIHIADATQVETYRSSPAFKELIDRSGIRTGVTVALRKDDAFLGTINVYRQEVRPFSDKQIALLQNFAAQAVIAMENARLLTETHEALEQQTATAEVLQVINSSPGNLGPVFDAMLERARRLCEPAFGVMLTWDGERFHRVAWRGAPPEVIEATREPVIGPPGSPGYRIAHGEDIVSIADLAENEATRPAPAMQTWVRLGVHSYVAVALRKEERLLGAIVIYRLEVRPFTDKEIALLQNFAAQAVIAMENARLLSETREALEQQTATAEVLQVINSSPGDLAPVFDAMLEKATQLCEAPRGQLATYDGEFFRFVAVHGDPGFTEGQFAQGATRPEIGVTWPRIVGGERFVRMVDVMASDPYRAGHEAARRFVDVGGGRSLLTVALRKDEVLLGALTIYRQEVRPFSNKQIALLQNFAEQAVIAMENARLLTETREALEQQTATAEVLGVINSSPGDLAPVFDAMLDKALRLCGATYGALRMWDGEHLTRAAWRAPQGFEDVPPKAVTAAPGSLAERFVRGENVISISDLLSAECGGAVAREPRECPHVSGGCTS
jgi:GAF domain-containing protein